MISRLGIYSLLIGAFVGVFSGISQFMGSKNIWIDLTMSKIIGKDRSETIMEFIPFSVLKNSLEYIIYSLPFYVFLFGLGIFLLLISLFLKNH